MDNATKTTKNPFWDYSLSLYAKPNAEAQLLQWQNQYNLDINLFLFAAWLLTQQRYLTTTQIPALIKWKVDVIKPIRQLRKILKTVPTEPLSPELSVASVRSLIKHAELLAEKNLQAWLYKHHAELSTPFDDPTFKLEPLKAYYSPDQITWLQENCTNL